MNEVLLIGGGGREHALAAEMGKSVELNHIYWASANPGINSIEKAESISFNDTSEVLGFAEEKRDGLTVVIGPEAPLVAGLGDQLRAKGVTVFGPSAAAAQLEGSKGYASDFMKRHDIPQPGSIIVRNMEEALRAIKDRDPQTIVLKADGLAGGKGVVLPTTQEETEATLSAMLSGDGFDKAGEKCVVIQERLTGPEISVFVLSDGQNFSIIPFFAQDHKRLKVGDLGPNTGGMGAYTPVPTTMISKDQLTKIQDIAAKTITGMAAEGTPYKGVVYMGLMLPAERDGDPVVIEYNVRFGDPEAQVILSSLTDSGVDVFDMIRETAAGNVPDLGPPQFLGRAALTVCLAAKGYPEKPEKGAVIYGLEKSYPNVMVHHGSTAQVDEQITVGGGRVLYITGRGESVDEAAAAAYAAIGEDGIHFEGMQYRTDIGHQARNLSS